VPVLGGKDTIQFFDKRQKLFVVLFHRYLRTELMDTPVIFLVHNLPKITGFTLEGMFGVERLEPRMEQGS